MRLLSTITDNDRHLWSPCFIEISDRLWMFASAWPKVRGVNGWRQHSRLTVVELDPTTYAKIGAFRNLEPLGSGRVLHSPSVTHKNGEVFLAFSEVHAGCGYTVGSARLGVDDWTVLEAQEDLFSASSNDAAVGALQGLTHPSLFTLPNGEYGMVMRMTGAAGSARRLYQATATSPLGPWSSLRPVDVGQGGDLDDPSIWCDAAGAHMLVRDIAGTATGVGWSAIGRLQSEDGQNWTRAKPSHVFNRTLPDVKAAPTLFFRTEAPSVFEHKGNVAIGFAVLASPDAVSHIRLYDWREQKPYLERPTNPPKPSTEIAVKSELPLIERIEAEHLTYLRKERLESLEAEMERLPNDGLPGLVVEFGVALGGSGSLLAAKLPRAMTFTGYDVFGQIPSPDENDSARSHARYAIIDAGESKGLQGETYYGYRENLMEEVKANFSAMGAPVDGERIKLVKGLFRETVSFPEETIIRLAHIDCDWYDPTMFCLDAVAPHIPKWGTIIIDDFDDWEGCRRATHEWLAANPDFRLRAVQPHAIIRRFEITPSEVK